MITHSLSFRVEIQILLNYIVTFSFYTTTRFAIHRNQWSVCLFVLTENNFKTLVILSQ